ncbi:Protein sickie [Nymphon striatum]|nr:Protein sickie [Nymphon striatum]
MNGRHGSANSKGKADGLHELSRGKLSLSNRLSRSAVNSFDDSSSLSSGISDTIAELGGEEYAGDRNLYGNLRRHNIKDGKLHVLNGKKSSSSMQANAAQVANAQVANAQVAKPSSSQKQKSDSSMQTDSSAFRQLAYKKLESKVLEGKGGITSEKLKKHSSNGSSSKHKGDDSEKKLRSSEVSKKSSRSTATSSSGNGQSKRVASTSSSSSRSKQRQDLDYSTTLTAQVPGVQRTDKPPTLDKKGKVKVCGSTQTSTHDIRANNQVYSDGEYSLGRKHKHYTLINSSGVNNSSSPTPSIASIGSSISGSEYHRGQRLSISSEYSSPYSVPYNGISNNGGQSHYAWLKGREAAASSPSAGASRSHYDYIGGGLNEAESIESLSNVSNSLHAQLQHARANSLTHAKLLLHQRELAASVTPGGSPRLSRSNSIRSTKSEKMYPSMLTRSEDVDNFLLSSAASVSGATNHAHNTSQPTSPSSQVYSLSTGLADSLILFHLIMLFIVQVRLLHTCPVCYLKSIPKMMSPEEKQVHEIRKLRRELEQAHDKVHTLTSHLNTNIVAKGQVIKTDMPKIKKRWVRNVKQKQIRSNTMKKDTQQLLMIANTTDCSVNGILRTASPCEKRAAEPETPTCLMRIIHESRRHRFRSAYANFFNALTFRYGSSHCFLVMFRLFYVKRQLAGTCMPHILRSPPLLDEEMKEFLPKDRSSRVTVCQTNYLINVLTELTTVPIFAERFWILTPVSSASHETSPRIHRAVTELDEEENWRERVEVLTKQDHGEYTQYAQDILNDLISSLPEESGNNYEEPAAAATTFDYSLDNSSFSDYESATEESKLGDLSIGIDDTFDVHDKDDNPRTICPSEIIETKHPVNDTVHPNTQTGNTVTETESQSNLNPTDSDKKPKNFVNISTDAHSAIVNDFKLNELQDISSNKLEEHIENTCAGEESVTKCETSVQEILEVHQQDSITKKSVLANLEESSVVLSEQSTQNFEKENFINKENLESHFPSVLAQPLLVADSEEICNEISSSDEIASGKSAEDFPPVTSKDTIQSFNENINSLKQCVDIVVEQTENIVEPVNKEDFSDQFDKSINSQKQCVDILAEQKEQFIEPFNSKESIEQFDENRSSQKPCVDIVVEPKEQFIEPVNKDYSTDQFDENINLQKQCVDIVAELKELSIEHFNSEESIEQFDENINLQKPCVDIVVEPTEKFVEPVNKEDFSNQFDKSINLQKQCVDILAEQKEQSIEPVNSEESIEQFDENINLQKPCVDILVEPTEIFVEPVNKEDFSNQFDKSINLQKQCVDILAEQKEQSIEPVNSEESIEQFDKNLNLQKPCVDILVEPTEKLVEPANKEDFSDQFDKSINLQEQCVDFVAEPKEQSIEHFNSEESIEQFDENLNLQKPCVDILVEPTKKFVEPANKEDFSDQCVDFVAEPKEQSIEHFNSKESIEQFDENLNLQKPCVDILVEPTEKLVEPANKEDFSDQFDKSINLQKQCVDILAEQKDQSIEPFNSEESIEQFDENRNSQKPCVDIVVEPKEQFIEPIDNKENNKVGPDFISGKPDPYIIEECASTVTEFNIQISNNSVQNLCAKQESNIINESTDNLLSFKTPSKTAINQPVSFDIENNAKALYKDLENSQGKITSVEECETPSFEDKNFVTGESSIVSLEPSKNSPDTIMDDAVPETPINNTENLPENSTHDSNNIDNVDTTMDSSENLPAKPAVNAYNFDFDPDFNPFATRSNVSSSPPKGSTQLADEDFNPFKTVSKVSSSPPPNSGLQTNVSLTEINLNKEKLDLDIIAQVKSNNSVHESRITRGSRP